MAKTTQGRGAQGGGRNSCCCCCCTLVPVFLSSLRRLSWDSPVLRLAFCQSIPSWFGVRTAWRMSAGGVGYLSN